VEISFNNEANSLNIMLFDDVKNLMFGHSCNVASLNSYNAALLLVGRPELHLWEALSGSGCG
jgi:hypothetical protein